MTPARRLLAALALTPALAVPAVVGGASPATAEIDGDILAPTDGQIVTGGSVRLSAKVEGPATLHLLVVSPGGRSQKVGEKAVLIGSSTLNASYTPEDARNGTYRVSLKGSLTGKVYDTASFRVRRPPATPRRVKASMSGKERVVVTWAKGREPDLQAYEVISSTGGVVGTLDAGDCGGSCEATLAVPDAARGKRVGFAVRAKRSDGDGGSVASGRSAMSYVTVPAAPRPRATAPEVRPPAEGDGRENDTRENDRGRADPPAAGELPRLPRAAQPTPDAASSPFTLPDSSGETADSDSALGGTGTGTTGGDKPQLPPAAKSSQNTPTAVPGTLNWGQSVAILLILLLVAGHVGWWARRRTAVATAPAADEAPASGPRRPAVILAMGTRRPAASRAPSAPGPRRRPSPIRLALPKSAPKPAPKPTPKAAPETPGHGTPAPAPTPHEPSTARTQDRPPADAATGFWRDTPDSKPSAPGDSPTRWAARPYTGRRRRD
ncbi:hypothetical protein [Bailinhaonella thermotolerans]|uniref:Fibronectin type-III domain-containing protein n=1 Tax=Bailinhaonella thermotolerans TaxID=1070861 RepID=A0A3A3ZZ63_9ACTN|nr:hypothetical protein [Bailinhaonella thermotolerans]RJL20404.1 hypothetical protein D5H75_39640 [Bailinhaonella thermotolerans]